MRISFVTAYGGKLGGGIPPILQKLSGLFSDRGNQLQLLTLNRDKEPSLAELYLHSDVIQLAEQPLGMGYGSGFSSAIGHFRPDLIHSQGIWVGLSGQIEQSGFPYVISPHGMLDPFALKISTVKKKVAGLLFENRHLKKARALHALTKSELNSIRAYGLDAPIAVIPNGIDPVAHTSDPVELPENWPTDGKVLLFLGRIHPKKGLLRFLESWKAIKPRDWHLVIAGWDQGDHQKVLETYCQEHGIRDQVHFIGPQFEQGKVGCLRHSHGFVLPSQSEGQPMSVLEAWAFGLPVLMTKACNLPEGFEYRAAMELPLSPSQPEVLQQFLDLSDKALAGIGSNGKVLVEAQFTWESAADKYIQLYEWVLGQGPQPDFVVID